MAVNKISYDVLAIAPDISKALELFESKFPVEEVLLTAYNSWFDMGFLYQAYQRLGKVVPFEKHAFDIWPFAYTYWSHAKPTPNPTKPIGFGLSDVASALGITAEGAYHDALTDCEVEAELLRRLTKTIRFQ
jgi:DNA polymerase III alpha subunit (gram-positive type)